MARQPMGGREEPRAAGVTVASALVLWAVLASACGTERPAADLVLRNGKIVTVDASRPRAEALAAVDDTIVALGSNPEIEDWIGPDTRVLDLRGRLAVPGFIESHAHFLGLGRFTRQLDLLPTRSWARVVALVDSAARTREPGEWILGRGWHQEKWEETPETTVRGFPTHGRLSEVAPENPVYLTHASGHAAIVNAAALEAAGIGSRTEPPPGGEIVRGPDGEPTGVLLDEAQRRAHDALERYRRRRPPDERRRIRREVALAAAREAVSHGVTTFHDHDGAYPDTLRLYRELTEAGELPVRLYAMVGYETVTEASAGWLDSVRTLGAGNRHLTVRSIGEVYLDGALGSGTAWMIDPYDDRPGETGLQVMSLDRLRELGRIALRHGYQLAVHAIGDRANREALDVFQALFDSAGVAGDSLRWRIEHVQHLRPEDVSRFGEMGVIASVQGIHACSDASYVVKRLGWERARTGAYMWRALWKAGAVVANGTDAPVEDIDPVANFHCTVTREILKVPGIPADSAFFPSQALGRQRALESYTLNGAYAGFEEDLKGSLAPGKLADVVVLSRDIMTVPPDSILEARVDYTVVGGRVVYRRGR